jgi:hypothetical protein
MRQQLTSVQVVFEDAPLLRLCDTDENYTDHPLRRTQLLMLAQQALAAFQLSERS